MAAMEAGLECLRINRASQWADRPVLITCIGPKALAIHNGLPFQSKDKKKNSTKIFELWESYYLGKTNIIYERYRFNNRNQDAGESIDTYTSHSRSLADACNFGTIKEEIIRDRFVCGVRGSSLSKKNQNKTKQLLQVPERTCLKSV